MADLNQLIRNLSIENEPPASIVATLNAALLANKGVLFGLSPTVELRLPPGTYYLTEPIVAWSGCRCRHALFSGGDCCVRRFGSCDQSRLRASWRNDRGDIHKQREG